LSRVRLDLDALREGIGQIVGGCVPREHVVLLVTPVDASFLTPNVRLRAVLPPEPAAIDVLAKIEDSFRLGGTISTPFLRAPSIPLAHLVAFSACALRISLEWKGPRAERVLFGSKAKEY
jgi:hypothetical protein